MALFPENLMGALVDYLSGADKVASAMRMLVYGGNPHLFLIRIMKANSRFISSAEERHFCLPTGLAGANRAEHRSQFYQQRPVDAGG